MLSFKEHNLDEMAAPTPGAAELIAQFDGSERGARGKFIAAAADKLNMKAITAGAYWQRNKSMATGGKGNGTASKLTKKEMAFRHLGDDGWIKTANGRMTKNGFEFWIIKDTNRGLTGGTLSPSGNRKLFADETPIAATDTAKNFYKKEVKKPGSQPPPTAPVKTDPKPKRPATSPLVKACNDLISKGESDSGNRVWGGSCAGDSTINGQGQVGRGGMNYRYKGVGAVERWQWGPGLAKGVRIFQSGHGHISGEKAEQITTAAIANKYIKAAQQMIDVDGVRQSDVDDVVYYAKLELDKYNKKQAAKKGAQSDKELADKQIAQAKSWLNSLSDNLSNLPIEQYDRNDLRYRIKGIREDIDSLQATIQRHMKV